MLSVALTSPTPAPSTPAAPTSVPARRRVVLVHGFTQSGSVWSSVAADLTSRGYDVLAPDLPGHGRTPEHHDGADLEEAARLLLEVGGTALYVGYSLGARVVLHAAVQRPDVMAGMVLVGAQAGLSDGRRAALRREADLALAGRIEALGRAGRFDEFIDEWLAGPVNERLPVAAQARDLRLANRPAGLAASLRRCGVGAQRPLWDSLADVAVPSLVLTGQYDVESVLVDNAGLAEALGANATAACVPGVGHSLPFEVPDQFTGIVDTFAATVYR